jgi:Zn-dependent protease
LDVSTTGLPGTAPLPPAELSQDKEFVGAMQALQGRKSWNAGLVLIVSLGLFLVVRQQQSASTQGIVVLLGVLFLHESGHYLGMRLFGYRDVRMFFIPLFGAAVSGKRGAVAAWKEGVVLLLGPVPGIAVAYALAANHASDAPIMRQVAISLVTINAFNLLPLAGLDGARLWQHVLFSRRRWLEIGFQLCAGLALAAVAVELESVALGVVAYLMLAILPLRWRVLRAADRVRAQGVAVPVDARDLEGDAARLVFREAYDALRWNHRGAKQVATGMELVVDAVNASRPSAGASAALALAWLLSVILAFKTLTLVVPPHRRPEVWQTAPRPQTLDLRLRQPRLLIEQPETPAPADEGAQTK